MKLTRTWAMPSGDTFSILPVAALLNRVLVGCEVIVDPFARNSLRGTITNDLNPETTAQHHMDALDFCEWLISRETVADAVLFDPPYSPRQITELYQQIGRTVTQVDTQNARLYRRVKSHLRWMLRPGGVAVCCGWNSSGLGGPLFQLEELMLVAHGGAHNDTIVTVERKRQGSLFKDAGVSVMRDAVDPYVGTSND